MPAPRRSGLCGSYGHHVPTPHVAKGVAPCPRGQDAGWAGVLRLHPLAPEPTLTSPWLRRCGGAVRVRPRAPVAQSRGKEGRCRLAACGGRARAAGRRVRGGWPACGERRKGVLLGEGWLACEGCLSFTPWSSPLPFLGSTPSPSSIPAPPICLAAYCAPPFPRWATPSLSPS
jgi:hypothetical protein